MLKTAFYLDVYGNSDLGLVREHNEDVLKMDAKAGIFIVADGMGGHNAGEIASKLAVDTVFSFLEKVPKFKAEILKKAFEEANAIIYKKGREDSSCHGMGTTLVTLVIVDETAFFAHVGDSRLYLFREGVLQQMTEDHTLVNELIALGTLNKNDDPSQFPFKHILTKAMGTHSKMEETSNQFTIKEHDMILLATDGLTNYVSEGALLKILCQKKSIKEKTEILIELAKNNGEGIILLLS